MHSFEKPLEGTLADFGCSNGFILSALQARLFEQKRWEFVGFDRSRRLLALAEARNLLNTEFHWLDLHINAGRWCDRFDIVTCSSRRASTRATTITAC